MRSRRWTPEEEARVLEATSVEEVARALGRSPKSIQLRAQALGVTVGGRAFEPRNSVRDPAKHAKGGPPPATRAGCAEIPRPCDRACRHRLDAGGESCALDVADRVALGDEVTHSDIADLLGVSRERVRQIEAEALEKLRQVGVAIYMGMVDDADQARVHLRILVPDA
jgi:biotin operon repressor